jgi:molybdate transport system regulatory protein
MARLTIRIDFSPTSSVGPGKIRLLELIAETGSISAAGRAMGMSYRRAWLLVDELNRLFKHKVATTTLGGKTGGGAALTGFGKSLVAEYRAMERDTHTAVA